MDYFRSLQRTVAALLPETSKQKLRPSVDALNAGVDRLRWTAGVALGRLSRALAPRRLPDAGGRVLVHLGCGPVDHPGFINVDGAPHRHVHFVHRIDRLPMFRDATVDLIYASHCLEHFRYRELDRVLAEWARVLRPGGTLRLSVPDLERLLAILRDTGDPDDIVEQLMGGQDDPYNFHYAVFNEKNLAAHLAGAGFGGIRRWVPGSDDLTTFPDFSVYKKTVNGKEYEVSLNLEAERRR